MVGSTDAFDVTVTFSEAVTGFDATDVTVTNGSATVSGSGTTYTASITPDGNGDITIAIGANVAEDAAGNGNDAATSVTVLYNRAPTFSSAATFRVAENATAVGTVTATDADASDSITGYALAGGADQGKFSIDTNSGALIFQSAPNYEDPTDTGTDNTYEVAVTATSGTSARALTATQTITVTVTDVNEPPSAPATPTISAVTATGFTVSWTAPANTGPAITDYAVQYRVSGDTVWTAASHSGTGLTVTLTGLTASTGYEVQVQATNAEGTGAWSTAATATTAAASGVTISETELTVDEDASATYTVVLDAAPTADVTIAVATADGDDADLTLSASSLTFTTSNWNTAQTVTVSAADDDDAAAGTATITHSASSTDSGYNGITIDSLKATENDDDTVGVTVDPERLSVTEESTATWTVVLDTQPTGAVTVSVAKQSGGDPSLTVSPAELTFTTDDWSTAQTVTVSAADDVDSSNGAATFTHRASGADYASVTGADVTATESDNDTPGVTVTPAVADGDRGVDGELHGGADHAADGGGDGERGQQRRQRPDGGPDHPHLHDGELGHGADGDGDRGGGRRRHGARHGDLRPTRRPVATATTAASRSPA